MNLEYFTYDINGVKNVYLVNTKTLSNFYRSIGKNNNVDYTYNFEKI